MEHYFNLEKILNNFIIVWLIPLLVLVITIFVWAGITEGYASLFVLLLGTIISILLFLILYSFFIANKKASLTAKDMSKENVRIIGEMKNKYKEFEKTSEMMMGREFKIIDLKKENKILKNKLNINSKTQKTEPKFYGSDI